jgi:hypothetical protein
MWMTRKCGACGNPAVDDVSAFCNKCGARLPAPVALTCKKCGKTFNDPNTRFCNRCGTSFIEPAPLISSLPATREKTETGTKIQKSMVPEPAPRNKPENLDIPSVKKSSNAGRPGLLHRIKDRIPQRKHPGSNRKVAAAAAGIVLMIIIIGVLAVYAPGILHSGPENSTAFSLASPADQGAALTATSGSSAGNTRPSTAGTQVPAINQAVTVTTDTSLNVTSS